MRPFARLVWKEGRELLRPRYVLPLLFLPLLFVAMGQGFAGVADDIGDRPAVGVVAADDDRLGRVAAETVEAESDVVYRANETPDSMRAATATVGERDGDALLVIPANFTERVRSDERATVGVYTPVDEVSILSVASSGRAESVLAAAERNVTLAATNATAVTLDPATPTHVTYVKGQRVDAPPAAISGAFGQQFVFVPVVIVFVVLVSGQMVIQSMGVEKEYATLETLLTMPVDRWKLVAAKLTAGGVVGLAATALYTGGIVVYQAGFAAFGEGTAAFALSATDYALVAVSLFVALVGVLALALCLGLFVDDRQGAQILLLPVSGLTLVPMFATMFADFDALPLFAKALLFAIPVTHPVIAPKRLLFGDVGLVLAGIAYEVAFAAAMVALAVRLFRSDRLVTGDAGRLGRALDFLQG